MSSAVSKRKLFDKWVEHRLSIPQHEMIERSTHTVRNARSIVVVRQNDDIPCRKSPLKGKGLGADSDNWGNVDFFFSDKDAQGVALECWKVAQERTRAQNGSSRARLPHCPITSVNTRRTRLASGLPESGDTDD